MRNRRAILFLLGCNLVFALALILFSGGKNRHKDASPVSSGISEMDKVSGLEINRIMPTGGSVERILISRMDGRWHIETPINAEADGGAVKRIIDSVVFAEPVDELSDSDMLSLGRSLRDFGLSQPSATVVLLSDDRREMFEFGRQTPSGNEVYVRKNGKGGVFTVPLSVVQTLKRPLGELRRRRIFTFGKMDVTMIGLKNAGGQLSKIVKDEKDGWRLNEPMVAPADKTVVEELIEAVCAANVRNYVNAGSNIAIGLGDNEGYAISLRDSFGTVEKLVLGAPADTNAVWAITPEGAVVHVDAELLSMCRSRQKILEDKRVFPVDMASVMSVSVTKGFPAYMISRQNVTAPWRLVSPVEAPADVMAVTNLLTRILALRGADLVPEGETNRIVLSIGTESTNFPPHGVSGSFMPDGIRLADLRDKTLMRYPQTEVKRIRIDTAAGSGWDATKSESMIGFLERGIIAESVETVMLQLDDSERCGFSHPSYTLTFELNDKKSAMRKLLLGAAAPGGGRYAMIGGSDAIFVLSAATVSTLTKPVEETSEGKSIK